MPRFNEILDKSKAVNRFAQLEGMSSDELYEYVFECFCSYMDMFKERLSYGREINRVMSAYREIDAFKVLTPRELVERMFASNHMRIWFAYRFWAEADKQITGRKVDRNELFLALTFTGAIPTTKLMEDILNEYANRGERDANLQAGGVRATASGAVQTA